MFTLYEMVKTQTGSLALVSFENRVPVDAKSFFYFNSKIKNE